MKYLLCLLLAGCASGDYCIESRGDRCIAWEFAPTRTQVERFGK